MLNRLRNHAELNNHRLEAGGFELADGKSSDIGNSRLVRLLYIKGENAHPEWQTTLETVIRSVKEMSGAFPFSGSTGQFFKKELNA